MRILGTLFGERFAHSVLSASKLYSLTVMSSYRMTVSDHIFHVKDTCKRISSIIFVIEFREPNSKAEISKIRLKW